MSEDLAALPATTGETSTWRPEWWFLNPYFVLLLGGVLDCGGELLLKVGASAAPEMTGALAWVSRYLGFSALFSPWTWLGFLSYIGGLACWLWVLRSIPLAIAFAIVNGLHIGVPLGARFMLHEAVNGRRWLGIAIVLAGVLLILKPMARAEEKL